MNVKTPSSSKVSKQGVLVGSAILGATASRGVAPLIPGGKLGKVALAAISLFGAAAVTGTTTGSDIARGALVGMAIQQTGDLAIQTIQPMVAGWVNGGDPSKLKSFIGKSVGLSSPDSFYEARYAPQEYIEPAQIANGQLGNPFPFRKATQLGVG